MKATNEFTQGTTENTLATGVRLIRRNEVAEIFTAQLQTAFSNYIFKNHNDIAGLNIDNTARYKFGDKLRNDIALALNEKLANISYDDRLWLIKPQNQVTIVNQIIDSGILQPKKAGIVTNGERYFKNVKTNFKNASKESNIAGRIFSYFSSSLKALLEGVGRILIFIPNLYRDYSWGKKNFGFSEIQPNDISNGEKNVSPAEFIADYIAITASTKDLKKGVDALKTASNLFKPEKFSSQANENEPATSNNIAAVVNSGNPVTIGRQRITPNGFSTQGAVTSIAAENTANQNKQNQL